MSKQDIDTAAPWSTATSPVPVRRYAFRPDFVFGAATSAYQVEGAIDTQKYGRGESIWERYFSTRPQSDTGEIACDHYNRMPEDVALMKSLNLQAYRFSIAWPRVLPSGAGAVNEQGVDFYKRLADKCRELGIEPFATLYHWDLPQAMEDLGGWTSRDISKRFGDYAELMARRLGDHIQRWGTLNEPEVIVGGYCYDGLAPGRADPTLGTAVAHNLMLGHGYATQALRSVKPDLTVGCTLNLVPIEPANKYAVKAARTHWQRNYSLYLDAMLKGRYPDVVLKEMDKNKVSIEPGDMQLINQKLDYLGVNWYLRNVMNRRGRIITMPAAELTQVGWEINPAPFTRMLVEMNEEYALPPIYITENGAAIDDIVVGGDRIHDLVRMTYIHNHLNAMENAVARGVDIRGYFAWSLMDNLEWSGGFKYTFGIVHVDRKTLKRTVKDSGLWYRDMIAANTAGA
jgi:beta-glucosidase